MQSVLASQFSMPKLLTGKYTRWAERLDVDTLEAALIAVGEFGGRYWAMRSSDGRLPAPVFQKHGMVEFRMIYALESFAVIRATGSLNFEMGSIWNRDFSLDAPAFSRDYGDVLAHNPYTAWARALDERCFAVLLWMIGEYGIRVNSSRAPDGGEYPPPSFDGPARQTLPMRAALRLIAMVESGARVDPAEAARIILAGTI
jgi:hypothetical protein